MSTQPETHADAASSDEAVAPTTDATPPADGDAAAPEPVTLDASLEAMLFASDGPLTVLRIQQITGRAKADTMAAVDRLNVFYAESGRAFRIVPLAGGFQLVTTPDHAAVVSALHKEKTATKLSRAALETLAIIAFKQPVTRAEIDVIRGVSASDGVLRHLMERSMVRIAGRAEAPGRPLLYGTTREFLAHFGLHTLSDLPRTEELAALLAGDPRRIPAEEPAAPPAPMPAVSVRPAWQEDEDEEEDLEDRSHSVEELDAHVGESPSQ